MSLIGFHRFLIATAILFCGGFAAWEFRAFTDGGSIWALVLGIGFAVAATGLAYYLVNLMSFLDGEPQ